MGIFGDVLDGEVVAEEGIGEQCECASEQAQLHIGGWACNGHPSSAAALGANQGKQSLQQCCQQGEDQEDLAKLRQHVGLY